MVNRNMYVLLVTFSYVACAEGAQFLNSREYDIAINWSGGLHHAKKKAASGMFALIEKYPAVNILGVLLHIPLLA